MGTVSSYISWKCKSGAVVRKEYHLNEKQESSHKLITRELRLRHAANLAKWMVKKVACIYMVSATTKGKSIGCQKTRFERHIGGYQGPQACLLTKHVLRSLSRFAS